jgi:putative transposase
MRKPNRTAKSLVRYPLSLRNVEDLLVERGNGICHETVRLWWNQFWPMFAYEIRKGRVEVMRAHKHWRWHLDEVYVKINGKCITSGEPSIMSVKC